MNPLERFSKSADVRKAEKTVQTVMEEGELNELAVNLFMKDPKLIELAQRLRESDDFCYTDWTSKLSLAQSAAVTKIYLELRKEE